MRSDEATRRLTDWREVIHLSPYVWIASLSLAMTRSVASLSRKIIKQIIPKRIHPYDQQNLVTSRTSLDLLLPSYGLLNRLEFLEIPQLVNTIPGRERLGVPVFLVLANAPVQIRSYPGI